MLGCLFQIISTCEAQMAFNVDKSSVEHILAEASSGIFFERRKRLLRCALLGPLCKSLSKQDQPFNLRAYQVATNEDPDWLKAAFNSGQTIYYFYPDMQTKQDIAHVSEWLSAAIQNDEPWLRDRDEHGHPRKLNKIGSLEQAVKEADKAMLIYAQKAAANLYQDNDGHEVTIETFDNGYHIVQLLTPEALDKESTYLGHCVGNGGYDSYLEKGEREFYSLRDKSGKGHATMEVKVENNSLLQCKGKQNTPPTSKYMPYIHEFVRERRFKLVEAARHTGLCEKDGVYYDVCNLPDGLYYDGHLDLGNSAVRFLPENLHVTGNLSLNGTKVTAIPDTLVVQGDLYLYDSDVCILPNSIFIGGNLYLGGTGKVSLTENFSLHGSIYLNCSEITFVPDNLSVGGDLFLNDTNVSALPNNLCVGGELYLNRTAIKALPDDLRVSKAITLPNGRVCHSLLEARQSIAQQCNINLDL